MASTALINNNNISDNMSNNSDNILIDIPNDDIEFMINNRLLHFAIDEYAWNDNEGANTTNLNKAYKLLLDSKILLDFNSKLNFFDDINDYKRFITSKPLCKEPSCEKSLSLNGIIKVGSDEFKLKINTYKKIIFETKGCYFIYFKFFFNISEWRC